MKALVTGITGFVGTHLAEHLLASGDEVLGTSRRGAWPADAPGELAAWLPLVPWDLAGPLIEAAAEGVVRRFAPDCIYHLAAVSAPANCGESRPTPHAMRVNVGGVEQVLELAAGLTNRPRVLFTSSSHVYAPVTVEHPQVSENAPLGPRRGYGMTKLAAEQAVGRAVADQGLDALVARPFQHLGPRQPAWAMLSEWACQAVRDRHAPIRAYNCRTWVDATDVRDMVRAYRLLVLHGRTGETFNVGSGVARLTGDILRELLEQAGGERAIVELEPGPRTDPIADNTRFVERTGWRPEVPLERTVADTLAWWRMRLAQEATKENQS